MAEQQRHSGLGNVRIRGTQEGLILELPQDLQLPELLGQVRATIDGGGDFYRQAQVVLDYATRVPNIEEIVALRAMLAERGVSMRTVTASTAAHREMLRSWGFHPLHVVSIEDSSHHGDVPALTADGERAALYVRRTLRSGALVHSDGDIVILGDVNAGAQVVAGGDVLIWGALRGTVHAGISGDFGAMICALRLMPTQLRIANIFARPPDGRGAQLEGPMVARVQRGEIVVEPWTPDRRPIR